MPFNVIIKEEAAADIDEAYLYYEGQKASLGQRFLDELGIHLDDLSETPHHYSFFQAQNRFRSHALDAFPYSVIYEIINSDVIVYAVYNTYKNPVGLFKRLL